MNVDLSSIEARARIHAALGDPARLAIADILAVGDASPGEIGAHLGMPTNLVAHHLGVLANAGVIDRRRSEHDRRRSYVRLQPVAITTLHRPRRLAAPARIVFVCTRNSARSQLAAALWGEYSPIAAASAGTEPATKVNPRAVRTAKRHGLKLDPHGTHHLDEVTGKGDLLIAVCDHVHETLPAEQTRLHWSIPDPVPVDTDEAFEAVFGDLADRIERLAPAIEEQRA
ncbi:ArsR family transcriptional regulator [Hamadaea sp. NPDC050747]|uniref:arsenate reductase/protein-tyrosine-phosphatase family protein n=1 Tax=Hamadaea sp. NPDC050747 TaxID=3155789 RepID=UPI0033F462CB